MGDNNITWNFRPRIDLEGDWRGIVEYCAENNIHISTVFNSLLPAINYALNNRSMRHDGDLYFRCDFGDVKLVASNMRPRPDKYL